MFPFVLSSRLTPVPKPADQPTCAHVPVFACVFTYVRIHERTSFQKNKQKTEYTQLFYLQNRSRNSFDGKPRKTTRRANTNSWRKGRTRGAGGGGREEREGKTKRKEEETEVEKEEGGEGGGEGGGGEGGGEEEK